MDNEQKSVELCNLGIAEKRKGNFEKALDYYEQAKNVYGINPNIYYNISKILIGIKNYKLAFKNILIYTHLESLSYDKEHHEFEMFIEKKLFDDNKRYDWNGLIYQGFSVNKEVIDKLFFIIAPHYRMIQDENAAFLAGLIYILERPEILKLHNINHVTIEDILNGLLGQNSNVDLKRGEYVRLINLTGLIYLYGNLNFCEINLYSIKDLYYSEKFVINNNLEKIIKDSVPLVIYQKDFVERNPFNKKIEESLVMISVLLKAKYELKNVFMGYNQLTIDTFNIKSDDGWGTMTGCPSVGHSSTMGFDINELKSIVSNENQVFLCYYAIPIDDMDYLIENPSVEDWDLEEFLSNKIKCNIISVGSLAFREYKRCRIFKFIMVS